MYAIKMNAIFLPSFNVSSRYRLLSVFLGMPNKIIDKFSNGVVNFCLPFKRNSIFYVSEQFETTLEKKHSLIS